MDITLARTFLAVLELGNFVKAAERLHVTQSTVSVRIKLLEDQLGPALFVRSKAGAAPTPAGLRFKPFAERLVHTWEQARQEAGLPETVRARLSLGVEASLWQRLLATWLPWMRATVPDVALHAEIGSADELMRRLGDGLLDLAITYTPQNRSGFKVQPLIEDQLTLVASPLLAETADGWRSAYIFVDWGPEFRRAHAETFPDLDAPILSTTHGPLALQLILDQGGAAYLPLRMTAALCGQGRLRAVDEAPVIPRPIHLVHPPGEGEPWFDIALQGLRSVALTEAAAQAAAVWDR